MKPILEFKTNRFLFLLPLPIVAVLVTVFFWAVFIADPPVFGDDITGTVVFSVLIVVGLIIFVASIRRFMSNRPDFVLYEEGFISNTNGVDLGFMKWSDVLSISESSLNTESGSENVMVITFRDPDFYSSRVGTALKIGRGGGRVLQFLQRMQPGSKETNGMPMYVDAGVFGKRYQQVLLLANELIIKNRR